MVQPPRRLEVYALKNWREYTVEDDWPVPLLRNLMKVRGDYWELIFDEENEITTEDEEIDFMIRAICTA